MAKKYHRQRSHWFASWTYATNVVTLFGYEYMVTHWHATLPSLMALMAFVLRVFTDTILSSRIGWIIKVTSRTAFWLLHTITCYGTVVNAFVNEYGYHIITTG